MDVATIIERMSISTTKALIQEAATNGNTIGELIDAIKEVGNLESFREMPVSQLMVLSEPDSHMIERKGLATKAPGSITMPREGTLCARVVSYLAPLQYGERQAILHNAQEVFDTDMSNLSGTLNLLKKRGVVTRCGWDRWKLTLAARAILEDQDGYLV